MSSRKKMPGDLMQRDVQGGLDKLEEFHRTIVDLDDAFNIVDIRAAYNSTPDRKRVEETVKAVRGRLESLITKFKYEEEPSYREAAVRYSDDRKMEREYQQQRVGYHDLRRFLQYHEVSLSLSGNSMGIWQDLQIKKIPGLFDRLITSRKKINHGDDLDIHVDLCENALRGIPAYGKDFEIDRDTITYKGNLQELLNAFQRDELQGIIVETYPRIIGDHLKTLTWLWLLRNACGTGYYYGQIHRRDDKFDTDNDRPGIAGGPTLSDRRGIAQIKFVFKMSHPKMEFTLDQQIGNRGGKCPTITELLFFGFGHDNPIANPVLKQNVAYKIDNDFKPDVFPKNSEIYFVYEKGERRDVNHEMQPCYYYRLLDDTHLGAYNCTGHLLKHDPPETSLYVL